MAHAPEGYLTQAAQTVDTDSVDIHYHERLFLRLRRLRVDGFSSEFGARARECGPSFPRTLAPTNPCPLTALNPPPTCHRLANLDQSLPHRPGVRSKRCGVRGRSGQHRPESGRFYSKFGQLLPEVVQLWRTLAHLQSNSVQSSPLPAKFRQHRAEIC